MAALSRSQKVRLGMFVGSGLTVLLGAFGVLAGRAMIEKRDAYTIEFTNKGASFSGLEIGSDVKYSGITIGRVEHLGVARGRVSVIEVTISTDEGSPIAEDSLATLESQGITGLKFIDLSRGSEGARIRKPGELIPAGLSVMEDLTEKATSVALKLEDLLVNIKAMTGPDTQARVQEILGGASGLVNDNRAHIASVVARADAVALDLTVLSRRGVSIAEQADQVMAKLSTASSQLQKALGPNGDFSQTLQQSGELVGRVNMLVLRSEGDLDVTLRNLRETSANLSDFSVAIKENPTILINNPKLSDDVGR